MQQTGSRSFACSSCLLEKQNRYRTKTLRGGLSFISELCRGYTCSCSRAFLHHTPTQLYHLSINQSLMWLFKSNLFLQLCKLMPFLSFLKINQTTGQTSKDHFDFFPSHHMFSHPPRTAPICGSCNAKYLSSYKAVGQPVVTMLRPKTNRTHRVSGRPLIFLHRHPADSFINCCTLQL